MEECARVLDLPPTYFLEYRLHEAKRDFDPVVVGHEQAIRNLAAWQPLRKTFQAG